MPDFSRRSDEPELMDAVDLSLDEFRECLLSLETINRLTLAYRPTLQWLRPWLNSQEPLRILDAGCGGGDMLRQIARNLPAHRVEQQSVQLLGVDLNPWSREVAESIGSPPCIKYFTGNVLEFESEQPVDIVICSLFTHHLTNEQLVAFLRWMHGRARLGWFINDLHRHPVPYHFIKFATRVFSRNRLIRNDAAVSVARSFTRPDWRLLQKQAGIDGASTGWYFPFRLCLSCQKV